METNSRRMRDFLQKNVKLF